MRRGDKRRHNPGRPPASAGGSAPVGGDDAAVVLSLRVSQSLLDETRAVAKAHGLSLSDLWRRAAYQLLGQLDSVPDASPQPPDGGAA